MSGASTGGQSPDPAGNKPRSSHSTASHLERIFDSIDPTNLKLHDPLALSTARNPQAIALEADGAEMTYEDLNRHAENVARHLQQFGVTRDQPVAIVARRSLHLPVALFGILKSGAAYVPIDPDQPEARVRYLIKDSGARIALVDSNTVLPGSPNLQVHPIEDLAKTDTNGSLRDDVQPTDLAYVIYTSGSTGKPKGVMVEHRSVMNRLLWMAEHFQLGSDEIQIQKTPITFDVSLHELFM